MNRRGHRGRRDVIIKSTPFIRQYLFLSVEAVRGPRSTSGWPDTGYRSSICVDSGPRGTDLPLCNPM